MQICYVFDAFGKNIVMEYGISIAVTILFIALYMMTKSKERERFVKKLDDEEFCCELSSNYKSMNIPSKTGKREYSSAKFTRKIKYVHFLAGRHISKISNFNRIYMPELYDFHLLIEGNMSMLKNLSKLNYSQLDNLPAFDNTLRIEKICRLILENNNYVFSEKRISDVFEFFNSESTLTFPEIQCFKLIAKFILLEKLNFVSERVRNLIKIGNYAKRVVAHPKFYEKRSFYNQVKTNNIFLHFSSSIQNLDCPSADLVYFDVIENINSITQKIFNGVKFLDFYNFEKFYTPLKFLEIYENFCDATNETKASFLTELSNQSTKLNIDELAYTYSLLKYYNRAALLTFKSKRLKFSKLNLGLVPLKSNMKLLALSLKSPVSMNLFFSPKKQKIRRA